MAMASIAVLHIFNRVPLGMISEKSCPSHISKGGQSLGVLFSFFQKSS
jgi:hypothetical protein